MSMRRLRLISDAHVSALIYTPVSWVDVQIVTLSVHGDSHV